MEEEVNHAKCARLMPQGYEGTVERPAGEDGVWSIIEAATFYDLPPLLDRVGDWALCVDGLYCLTTSYPIASSRLENDTWLDHMREKDWVNMRDFHAALLRAISLKQRGYMR